MEAEAHRYHPPGQRGSKLHKIGSIFKKNKLSGKETRKIIKLAVDKGKPVELNSLRENFTFGFDL